VNKQYLNSLLKLLDPEEKALIMFKYGLIDGKERDIKGMLAIYKGASESEIKRRLEQALSKLRGLGNRDKVNLEE